MLFQDIQVLQLKKACIVPAHAYMHTMFLSLLTPNLGPAECCVYTLYLNHCP